MNAEPTNAKPDGRPLVSTPGLTLVEREADVWVLHTGGGEPEEFDDLAAALSAMNSLLPDYPDQVSVVYHVAVEELTDVADEDEGLLPNAVNGWLHGDIGWMPVGTAEDPYGAETIVHEVDAWGANVYLHQWGNTFALYRSGVEGQDSEWRSCIATDLVGARAEAEAALDDLLWHEGMVFPPFMGLDNVDSADVYSVPADAVPVQRRTSFWTYGEMFVCELTVYRHETDGRVRFLVVDDETNKVIGEYESLEAIDDAETLDDFERLEYTTEDIDPDDE